ncbi:MsnO8 family LLM class oxidoreductase [Pseudonocardia benzenivorans]|uniref:MsnO8 family LLM class oxidoreductase n=1 Tax=Pseudonocardia benzenivorans TaxID=228005 RepID=A0ABW3VG63_9PSEU|nr:alkane monooxygenase [Pseudonocardia sp. D17]
MGEEHAVAAETGPMRYSVVELAPVAPGGTRTAALRRALAAAVEAEQLGYDRIWYAEHHHTVGYASADPVPLIAAAVGRTDRIRVGSGAVLLNHHSAFTVTERFMMLQSMAPGRVDLGIGRSSAGPVVDQALRRDRGSRPVDDFPAQVQEVLGHVHRAFPQGHRFATLDLTRAVDGVPEVWLLGSSVASARLAARLGIGYVFGAHIDPATTQAALDQYRAGFVGTPFGSGAPRAILALHLAAADDEDLAHRLTWPARALRAGGRDRPIPTVAQAAAELGSDERARPSSIRGPVIPPQVAGTAEALREQLEPLVRALGVTEVMVQDMINDVELRSRSREIVAKVLGSIDAPAS